MSSKKKEAEKNEKKSSKGKTNPKLPERVEERRTRASLGNEAPSYVNTFESHDAFRSHGFDNSFDITTFIDTLDIKVTKNKPEKQKLELDIVGIDPPIANAIRRITIGEVPTVAIETVWISNNTSVMPDEVLAHRLGLIPIKVNPDLIQYETPEQAAEALNPDTTVVFTLDVTCKRKPNSKDDAPPEEKYIGSRIYSSDLIWKPIGNQADMYETPPAPVDKDILIMKLRPGQSINLEAHCKKGIGRTHAKWSPVCTSSYRLMPEISFVHPIEDEEAEELVKVCPMNVFDIEDTHGGKRAVVARPRKCTMCRECIRDPKRTPNIKLSRVKDHFIFSVESTGIIPPSSIFTQALDVLIEKCTTLEREMDKKYDNGRVFEINMDQ